MTARESIGKATEILARAATDRVACEPVSDIIGPHDIDAAYEVQQALIMGRVRAGSRIVGRKIGLTSPAVQAQIGVDRPDFGVLLDDMAFTDGDEIPIDRLLQPKAEAEVAFVMSADIEDVASPAGVRAAVDCAYAALEIVDSRIADWRIGITDTVADNASSGVFILGTTPLSLDRFEPVDATMRLLRGDEEVSRGDGTACLGDPLNALEWLASTAIDYGSPLRAGDIVLSGALGPMVPVRPGDVFTATIDPLGTVTARFSGRRK